SLLRRTGTLAPGEGRSRRLCGHAHDTAVPDQRPQDSVLSLPAAQLSKAPCSARLRRHSSGARLGRAASPARAGVAQAHAAVRQARGVIGGRLPADRAALLAILLIYVGLASGYALATPRWNNPDEPAHYNYIAYLGRTGQFPVLQPGDWDSQRLGE